MPVGALSRDHGCRSGAQGSRRRFPTIELLEDPGVDSRGIPGEYRDTEVIGGLLEPGETERRDGEWRLAAHRNGLRYPAV
jgi:hypothetical protein